MPRDSSHARAPLAPKRKRGHYARWRPPGTRLVLVVLAYVIRTSRGSRDISHDDRGQAGASGHSVPVSSLVLRRQAQARSTEASGKGFHIGATRPRPAGWQDEGHHGAQDSVITSTFDRRRPPLVRIASTSFPLSNWPLLDPFPLNIWGEDQGLYK